MNSKARRAAARHNHQEKTMQNNGLLMPETQLQVRMLTGYAQPFNFQFPTGPNRFEQRQSLGLTKVEHVALHLAMAAFESGEDWNAGDLAAKAIELLDACDTFTNQRTAGPSSTPEDAG